jgi:hypothetical protein
VSLDGMLCPIIRGGLFTNVRTLFITAISSGKMGRCRFQSSHKRGSMIIWTHVWGIINVSTFKSFVYYYFKGTHLEKCFQIIV